MDKGIENLLTRLKTNLVANRSHARIADFVDQALVAMYEAGRAEVARDQAPCDARVQPPGADRAALCMRLAGHPAPHESADGCQWWSGADGSVLAALSRTDEAEATERLDGELGQADVES